MASDVFQLGVDDYTHWIARGRNISFAMLPQLHLKWKFLVFKPFRQDIDDTFKGRRFYWVNNLLKA